MILKPMITCLEEGTMLSKATAGQCLSFCYDYLTEAEFDAMLTPSQREVVHASAHVQRKKLSKAETAKLGGFSPGYVEELRKLTMTPDPKSTNLLKKAAQAP